MAEQVTGLAGSQKKRLDVATSARNAGRGRLKKMAPFVIFFLMLILPLLWWWRSDNDSSGSEKTELIKPNLRRLSGWHCPQWCSAQVLCRNTARGSRRFRTRNGSFAPTGTTTSPRSCTRRSEPDLGRLARNAPEPLRGNGPPGPPLLFSVEGEVGNIHNRHPLRTKVVGWMTCS